MSATKHTTDGRKVYLDGVKAHRTGAAVLDCEYPNGSQERKAWLRGFFDSAERKAK
jgi:hypothetical protein